MFISSSTALRRSRGPRRSLLETDAAEAAVERRYGSWRMLARHAAEASRRAEAFARLELALAQLPGDQPQRR